MLSAMPEEGTKAGKKYPTSFRMFETEVIILYFSILSDFLQKRSVLTFQSYPLKGVKPREHINLLGVLL